MILLAHPTGNAYVREQARALAEAGVLGEFWTCLNWQRGTLADRLLPDRLAVELRRRSFDDLGRIVIRTCPGRELLRLAGGRLGLGQQREDSPLSVDQVFRSFDRRVARQVREATWVRALLAHEDGAESTFAAAGQRGLPCAYDLPIGYWRAAQALFTEEAAREPEWAATMPGRLDSEAKLSRKDAELAHADLVLVASQFTRTTLAMAPSFRGRVVLNPYGAPEPVSEAGMASSQGGPLKVIYIGSLTQRKGLSYLLSALQMLGPSATLTLIGQRTGGPCRALDQALKRHRWQPSLPHAEVLREIRHHDVLVFPSLFEGFGLVILEALSQAVPVITTPHTGGPDVLNDHRDGFLVPIRSASAIAARLETLLRDRELLAAMKHEARRTAARLGWEHFRRRIVTAMMSLIDSEPGPDPTGSEGDTG